MTPRPYSLSSFTSPDFCSEQYEDFSKWCSKSFLPEACVASLTNSPQACADISKSNPFGTGQDDCYTVVAILNKDPNICEKSYPKDSCYFDYALAQNDYNVCDKSLNPTFCYTTIAGRLNDIKICEIIVNVTGFKHLYYDCLEYIAITHNNPSICEKLVFPYDSQRDNCYYRIGISMNDTKLCNKAIYNKNNCQGVIKLNSSLCGSYECYSQIAIRIKDPSICEKANYKSGCYSEYAKFTGDAEFCEKTEYRNLCYEDVAQTTNNIDLCKNASNIYGCVEQIAINLGNADLCSKLDEWNNPGYFDANHCYYYATLEISKNLV